MGGKKGERVSGRSMSGLEGGGKVDGKEGERVSGRRKSGLEGGEVGGWVSRKEGGMGWKEGG